MHNLTYKWECSKYIEKHPEYYCLGHKCKFIHDQIEKEEIAISKCVTQLGVNAQGQYALTDEDVRPRRHKRRKRTSYLDSVNTAATKDSVLESASEVSELEVSDEFYLSDVVSKTTTQHNPNPNKHLTPECISSTAGSTQTLTNKGSQREKRLRRTQSDSGKERSHYLHLIAKEVVNVGVHVVHKNIVLTEDKLCVLSLGTTFVPNPRKHKREILSYALDKRVRNVRLKHILPPST